MGTKNEIDTRIHIQKPTFQQKGTEVNNYLSFNKDKLNVQKSGNGGNKAKKIWYYTHTQE